MQGRGAGYFWRADRKDRESRSRPGTPEAVPKCVEIDPVGVYAELGQALALGGEVVLVGGAARVADQGPNHDRQCNA